MVTWLVVMDALINPSAGAGDVVLLAIGDVELMAMIALMLEMAGYRVVPVDSPLHTFARAREVHPRAIVADVREGDAEAWDVVHRLQHEAPTAAVRLVIVTQRPEAVPADIPEHGAAIVRWPCAVGDLLRILTAH